MKKLLVLAAAMNLASPSAAAALSDAIRGDMPMLMNLYRDLHANPELSMQEVRTPAKLAPEMRKAGFEVTEHVGKTGLVAVMKNGPFRGGVFHWAATKKSCRCSSGPTVCRRTPTTA